jgi:cation transport ATPase
MSDTPLVVFIDVDDTLIRTVGSKRIPIVDTVAHVRRLKAEGAQLHCWSAGGAAYAEEVATQLGLGDCFAGYLPKPHIMIDDQAAAEWRRTVHIHPVACAGNDVVSYRQALERTP